jgi:hypothetical protein
MLLHGNVFFKAKEAIHRLSKGTPTPQNAISPINWADICQERQLEIIFFYFCIASLKLALAKDPPN